MHHIKLKLNQISNKGFTLIELLVVIGIIGIIFSISLASLNSAKEEARKTKAQAELQQLHIAIEMLYSDTSLYPAREIPKARLLQCGTNEAFEVHLNRCDAGLECTDGNFPSWAGPYINDVPLDPWGTNYFFDTDFLCGPDILGCDGVSATVSVIQSFGPNKVQNYADSNIYDDVVRVLCRP